MSTSSTADTLPAPPEETPEEERARLEARQAELEREVFAQILKLLTAEATIRHAAVEARHAPDAATRERYETALTALAVEQLTAHRALETALYAMPEDALWRFVRRVQRDARLSTDPSYPVLLAAAVGSRG